MNISEAENILKKYGQEHLLAFYDELDLSGKQKLLEDIGSIDFELMNSLYENAGQPTANNKNAVLTPLEACDASNLSEEKRGEYENAGLSLIANGRVATVTMAGGQGTRLGHDGPKGTYDIGLSSHKSLFEIQCDGLKKAVKSASEYIGRSVGNIPWYIMTSQINHRDTVLFFEQNDYFGYGKENIFFFPQNMIPVLSTDGKMLLDQKDKILRSPDGNGGLFAAIKSSGALEKMKREGVEFLFICGIDNCLVKPADPLFVGFTAATGAEATAKSFIKRTFDEKAGILCRKNGHPGVVEYTEIPEYEAKLTDGDGVFVFGDANVLNYVFRTNVLESITSGGLAYHTACKKIEFLSGSGERIKSEKPDAYKFEMFLFDAFDHIDDMRVLRINRTEEFAPVKNKDGEDSPATARKLYMAMNKIKMTTPLVEMDGDEMTRIVWQKIKEKVLLPFVDLKTEYYDLGIQNRDATDDRVTVEAAEATKKYGVAVKCATITPNASRVKEYNLKKMYKSPNGTIRAILDGTVFRKPILVNGISPLVKNWKKPIVIARHAYGDIYSAVDSKIEKGSKAELVITGPDGTEKRMPVHEFEKSGGIVMGMHNEDRSIENFARACFEYALSEKTDLWFSAKDTISKVYDGEFRDVFADLYEKEYKEKFESAGISYFYTLVDDAIARVMKSEGGFLWACKNYDGDVFSDMLATSFGSLAMMTSVLVSPQGYFEYEAAHGTVTRHYYKYLKGEQTSTNPVATLFAWTGALAKRGELDGLQELVAFAKKIENTILELVGTGYMTGDLALITELSDVHKLSLDEFLDMIAERL